MRISKNVFAVWLIIASIAVFAVVAGAGESKQGDKATATDVKKETMEAVEAIKNYSVQQRNKAVKKADEVMKDLDARIDQTQARIQDKWNEMDQAAREKTKETLRELREQRNELSEWYGGLKHSSADAWDHVKKGFADGYESLAAAFDRAEKEFDSGEAGKN